MYAVFSCWGTSVCSPFAWSSDHNEISRGSGSLCVKANDI